MQLTKLLIALSAALGSFTQTEAKINYAGVSVSSGEFGVYNPGHPGSGLPGRFGVDYQFINKSAIDIQISQGINLFRVAFLLERMCPLAYGLGSKFNETHYNYYADAVNYITGKGAYVLTDPHNYMRYNDPSAQPSSGSVIGDTTDPKAATTAQFAAFHAEMARRFMTNPKVIFGLVNEPHDMSTALILKNNQAAINAIRATGAKQMITAPGNGYTGGHIWTGSSQGDEPSSQYLGKLSDPMNNTAIEIHEYLDTDFSGGNVQCVNSFQDTLGPLTTWLKQNNLKALIAEFGGSNTTACTTLINSAVQYVANNDQYIGIAAWASGPLWYQNSPCCNHIATDTNLYGSLEPGSTGANGSPSFYETVWLPVILPAFKKYYSTLKRSGTSSVN